MTVSPPRRRSTARTGTCSTSELHERVGHARDELQLLRPPVARGRWNRAASPGLQQHALLGLLRRPPRVLRGDPRGARVRPAGCAGTAGRAGQCARRGPSSAPATVRCRTRVRGERVRPLRRRTGSRPSGAARRSRGDRARRTRAAPRSGPSSARRTTGESMSLALGAHARHDGQEHGRDQDQRGGQQRAAASDGPRPQPARREREPVGQGQEQDEPGGASQPGRSRRRAGSRRRRSRPAAAARASARRGGRPARRAPGRTRRSRSGSSPGTRARPGRTGRS